MPDIHIHADVRPVIWGIMFEREGMIMKRPVTVMLTSMMIAGLLTGCGQLSDIGKDKAAKIALADANLTDTDVTRLRVSKDHDDGQSIYEVEFTNENTEYEYEILASNGDILSADYEESHTPNQQNQNGQQTQNGQQNPDGQQTQNGQQSPDGQQTQDGQQNPDGQQTQNGHHNQSGRQSQADVQLSIEDASALALERVPGATQQDLKIELDYDDAYYKYEGDIIYDQKEYEFEIDANTGEFLEWKEERR